MELDIARKIGEVGVVVKASSTNLLLMSRIFEKRAPLSVETLYSTTEDYPEEYDYTNIMPLSVFGYKKNRITQLNETNIKPFNSQKTITNDKPLPTTPVTRIEPVVATPVQQNVQSSVNQSNNTTTIETIQDDVVTDNANNESQLLVRRVL